MAFRKPYSGKDGKRFDGPAKKATEDYLKVAPNLKVTVRELDREMGIDMYLHDGPEFLRHLEIETKDDSKWRRPWTKTEFPWPDVNFLLRKLKHLEGREGGYDARGLWVLWNHDYTQHLVVKFSDIEKLYREALEIEKNGGPKALVHVSNRVEREAQAGQKNKEPDLFLKIPLSIAHLNGLDEVIARYGKQPATTN